MQLQLTCPIDGRNLTKPVTVPCGHTFNWVSAMLYVIQGTYYCPLDGNRISLLDINPDLDYAARIRSEIAPLLATSIPHQAWDAALESFINDPQPGVPFASFTAEELFRQAPSWTPEARGKISLAWVHSLNFPRTNEGWSVMKVALLTSVIFLQTFVNNHCQEEIGSSELFGLALTNALVAHFFWKLAHHYGVAGDVDVFSVMNNSTCRVFQSIATVGVCGLFSIPLVSGLFYSTLGSEISQYDHTTFVNIVNLGQISVNAQGRTLRQKVQGVAFEFFSTSLFSRFMKECCNHTTFSYGVKAIMFGTLSTLPTQFSLKFRSAFHAFFG